MHIIFQIVGLEPQVNLTNSNMNIPNSNSVWSVFDTLYHDHSVSGCSSSSNQSLSFTSLLDDTEYIATLKASTILTGPTIHLSDDATQVQDDINQPSSITTSDSMTCDH